MKNLLIAAAGVMMAIAATAQTKVNGTVLDSLSQKGEPYVTVSLAEAGGEQTPLAATVTDMDGKFELVAKKDGDYVVRVASIGKRTITREIKCNGQTVSLGEMLISEDTQAIEGIDVVAQKPLVKVSADELEYSVEDDPDSKINTVLDMLKKVPLVSVDGQDNITVNGSSSFQVYVNGKPNQMLSANASMIFKAMPASAVKSITVVTNPGAKYDAEGAGGVLSITLAGQQGEQASTDGYMMNLSAVAGTRNNMASVYDMMQKGKVSFDINAAGGYFLNNGIDMELSRKDKNGNNSITKGSQKNNTSLIQGTIGANIDMNDDNALQVEGGFMTMKTDARMNLVNENTIEGTTMKYSQRDKNKTEMTRWNGSVDYTHKFGEKNTLIVGYRVSNSPNETSTETTYEGYMADSYTRKNNNEMLEQIASADYTLKANDMHTIELGGKFTSRKSKSDADEIDYNHDNNITAGYASYGLSAGNASIKTGVRYEYTSQKITYNDGKDFGADYDNIVPSASIGWRIGTTKNIGLAYNMRISRPGITYLNPYVDDIIKDNVTMGNPDLDVEKSNNIQLTFGSFGQKVMLNATLKHSFTDNGIQQYSYTKDNVMYTTYGNIGKNKTTSLDLYLRLTLSATSSLTIQSGTSYADLKAEKMGYHNSGWSQTAMVYFMQQLPKDFSLTAYYSGSTKTIGLQGKTSGMNIHALIVSKSFMSNKMTLTAQVLNPFYSKLKMHSNVDTPDFNSKNNIDIELRSVLVQFSYRLGNLNRQRQSRQHDDNDVIQRESNATQNTGSGMGM